MSELIWERHGPAPDPFEAAAGDRTEYVVHLARSDAEAGEDLRSALTQVLQKALSFAGDNVQANTRRILMLWDVVYSDLAILYNDGAHRDSRHTTKCLFPSIDARVHAIEDARAKEAAWSAVSATVRGELRSVLASPEIKSKLPTKLEILFSDNDRASCTPEEFEATLKTLLPSRLRLLSRLTPGR